MSYLDPYEDEEEASSNYFVRQWKGQNSLPFAYWVNGSVLTAILSFACFSLGNTLRESGASLQLLAGFGLASIVLLLAVWVWSGVGIWRSADRHPYRGGSRGWATAAKFMIFLGCLATLARLPGAFLETRELGQLAIGADPIGAPATMALRGTDAVVVRGFLTQGSASRFAALLDTAPDVRTLVLDSLGGRTLEGERMAALVRARGLDTIAENACASACTMPFVAGKRRLLAASTRLGFHQPTFPGATRQDLTDSIAAYQRFLHESNIEPRFVERAVRAAPDDMWFPDLRELIDAGVITGFAESAVAEDNRISAAELGRRTPMRIDPVTTLLRVEAKGAVLEYMHRIDRPARALDIARIRGTLPQAVRAEVCAKPDMVLMIDSGAIYRYSYVDLSGAPLLGFDIAC